MQKNSSTEKAREKISANLESPNFLKFFEACLTSFKNNQIDYRFLASLFGNILLAPLRPNVCRPNGFRANDVAPFFQRRKFMTSFAANRSNQKRKKDKATMT
jgi:hypothetical protein